MAKIASYSVLDFSGGVRRDLSFFDFKKNELLDARNVDINEKGRIYSRRGSYQIGQTLASGIENSFFFQRSASTPATSFFVNNNATTGVIYRLLSGQLSTAITTASASIVLTATILNLDTTNPSIVEIEGDLISYTGGGGTTTLTGVTGIAFSHAAGAAVNQWTTVTQDAGAIDPRRGVYYAVLNNVCFINARGGGTNWKYIDNDDAVTTTAGSTMPVALFVTNYRDRLYAAGELNPQNRVYFSNRGTGITWTIASDFFDVEDQRGEPVTGFKVTNDNLGIFKPNSIFTYNEIELKQKVSGVGAYNHKVIQEIDGLIYTFCPNGIFVTNLFSSKQIGDPIKQYWKNFQPIYETIGGTAYGRVIINTFSGAYEQYYILYIQDITNPDVTNDVTLVYDTIKKTWQVYTGMTNFQHLNGFSNFKFGGRLNQFYPSFWGGNDSGQVVRFFDSKFVDVNGVKQGTDVFQDRVGDVNTPVSASFETPLYDLTHPELFKKFNRLRVYTEQGQWNMEYRIQDENGIGQYKPLGIADKIVKILPFPTDARGYRVGFRVSAVNSSSVNIFNGFVIEETEVVSRQ